MNLRNSQSAIEPRIKAVKGRTPQIETVGGINLGNLDVNKFWIPEVSLSLYGVAQFMELPIENRIRLSHFEFLHIVDCHLWLESLLMARISGAAARGTSNISLRKRNLLKVLEQETQHSLVYMDILHRCGMAGVNNHSLKWNILNLIGRFSRFESPVFWTLVLLGEQLPDRFNKLIVNDSSGICATIQQITKAHIMDNADHMHFASYLVGNALKSSKSFELAVIRPVLALLFFLIIKLYYYPPANIYQFAGLKPGRNWAKLAAKNKYRAEFLDNLSSSVLFQLHAKGLKVHWF